jgi:hypothetical protein
MTDTRPKADAVTVHVRATPDTAPTMAAFRAATNYVHWVDGKGWDRWTVQRVTTFEARTLGAIVRSNPAIGGRFMAIPVGKPARWFATLAQAGRHLELAAREVVVRVQKAGPRDWVSHYGDVYLGHRMTWEQAVADAHTTAVHLYQARQGRLEDFDA